MQVIRRRARYLQDSLQTRLGGLAANLARIKSFSDDDEHKEVVFHLIEESKYFIEWSAPEVELPLQADMVLFQVQLSLWQNKWDTIWTDPLKRMTVVNSTAEWATRIIEESGLLKSESGE